MTEFEIIFVVFGIGACIVGAIHVTIAYRCSIRDVEPDPERVRRFVERGMELRRQALKNRAQPTIRATTSPSQSLQIFPRGKRILIELVAYAAPLRHIVVKDLDETLIMARRYQVGELMQQYVLNRPNGFLGELEIKPDDFLVRIAAAPFRFHWPDAPGFGGNA
nr:hypothetical protein [Phaeobacter sp. B1627]